MFFLGLFIVVYGVVKAGLIDILAYRAHAEQRHVVEDVLALKQPQFTAGQDLHPTLEPDRHEHLSHVDLRAGLN